MAGGTMVDITVDEIMVDINIEDTDKVSLTPWTPQQISVHHTKHLLDRGTMLDITADDVIMDITIEDTD